MKMVRGSNMPVRIKGFIEITVDYMIQSFHNNLSSLEEIPDPGLESNYSKIQTWTDCDPAQSTSSWGEAEMA